MGIGTAVELEELEELDEDPNTEVPTDPDGRNGEYDGIGEENPDKTLDELPGVGVANGIIAEPKLEGESAKTSLDICRDQLAEPLKLMYL